MLLDYLYSNFLEESSFADTCGTSPKELAFLVEVRTFPVPSYIYDSKGRSLSFVTDFSEEATYRFHLRGHATWFQAIERLGLHTERRARHHFFNRYDEAREMFLTSEFVRLLTETSPEVPKQLDVDHENMTWDNFLNGVYGVCTRDGQPESVFLKQVGVMFIEQMTAAGPGSLSRTRVRLLERTVSFLDTVESEFAPHEVLETSRQRCIVDVNAKFLDEGAV